MVLISCKSTKKVNKKKEDNTMLPSCKMCMVCKFYLVR